MMRVVVYFLDLESGSVSTIPPIGLRQPPSHPSDPVLNYTPSEVVMKCRALTIDIPTCRGIATTSASIVVILTELGRGDHPSRVASSRTDPESMSSWWQCHDKDLAFRTSHLDCSVHKTYFEDNCRIGTSKGAIPRPTVWHYDGSVAHIP